MELFNLVFLLMCIPLIVCDELKINSYSIDLNENNFKEKIAQGDFLVFFYSSSNELNDKFVNTFESLAKQIPVENPLKLGTVNCNTNPVLCVEQQCTGSEIFLYSHEGDRIQFNGVRNAEGLVKFLVNNLGKDTLENVVEIPEKLDAINELTDETFTDHVATGQHFVKFYAPWCGHCQRLAPVWDELANAAEYHNVVSISKIDCTIYRPICQDFEVKGYPTLLWIAEGKKVEKYTGSRALSDLKSYVDKIGNKAPVVQNVVKEQTVGVLQLTSNNFKSTIQNGITFIKFFAPWCGHCKRMAPTWDELADKFQGSSLVKVAKVDCTLSENKELCSDEEVNGFPAVFIYKDGTKLNEYEGSRSLDDLYSYVLKYTKHDEL